MANLCPWCGKTYDECSCLKDDLMARLKDNIESLNDTWFGNCADQTMYCRIRKSHPISCWDCQEKHVKEMKILIDLLSKNKK